MKKNQTLEKKSEKYEYICVADFFPYSINLLATFIITKEQQNPL